MCVLSHLSVLKKILTPLNNMLVLFEFNYYLEQRHRGQQEYRRVICKSRFSYILRRHQNLCLYSVIPRRRPDITAYRLTKLTR